MSNNLPKEMNGMQFVNIVNNALDKRDSTNTQRIKNMNIPKDYYTSLQVSPEKNNIDEAYAPFLEENLEIKIDTYKPFYEYCFVTRDASNTYSHNLNHQQLELVWENSFTIPQANSIVKDRIKYVSFTHGLYDYGGNVKNIEMNIYDGKESLLGKYTASPYEDIVVPIDDIITTKEQNIKLKIKLFAQSYSLLDKVYVGPAYCKLKDYQYLPWNIFFKK